MSLVYPSLPLVYPSLPHAISLSLLLQGGKGMGRIYTKLENEKRHKIAQEITKLTDELNRLVGVAIRDGISPDVSIHLMALSSQPVIRVDFFRDTDAIQN